MPGPAAPMTLGKWSGLRQMSWMPEPLTQKLDSLTLNAVIVGLLAAYCSYTVLNVDADICRGWSIPEKAVRVLGSNWGAYEASIATTPVLTKTCINTVIYMLADWLSQYLAGAKPLEFVSAKDENRDRVWEETEPERRPSTVAV